MPPPEPEPESPDPAVITPGDPLDETAETGTEEPEVVDSILLLLLLPRPVLLCQPLELAILVGPDWYHQNYH